MQFIYFIYEICYSKIADLAAREGNLFLCVLIITSCIIWLSLIEYWYKLINCLSGAQCYYKRLIVIADLPIMWLFIEYRKKYKCK